MDFSQYTTLSTPQLLEKLKTSQKGLDFKEAEARLKQNGLNQLTSKKLEWWHILKRQFTSPFVYLLFGAFLVSFFLGEMFDGLIILLFVTINTILGFYQEYRSEQTLKLLNKYLISKLRVIRNGSEEVVEVTHLVTGDIVILTPGDIIPTDVRFIDTYNLTIDESILTGESLPAQKTHLPLKSEAKDAYKASNIGFSGTTVASGKGVGVVIATGDKTNYGSISKLASQTTRESIFEKQIAQLSKFTLAVVLVTLLLLVLANIAIKESPSFGELAVFSIALAVSVIPEALPTVITFSLSLGALRLTKKHVIVKRLSAIEDLGSIEVFCCDKTGTLTENKLTVDEIFASDTNRALLYANLASLSSTNKKHQVITVFEEALFKKLEENNRRLLKTYSLVKQIPFDPLRKRATAVVIKNGKQELATIGSPEDVVNICMPLSQSKQEEINYWVTQKGLEGKRVLAIALKPLGKRANNETYGSETDLTLLGLVSFIDPIKPTAFEAIQQAKELGISIKILTGDSKEVAGYVAHQIKLVDRIDNVMTGYEFESLTVEEKREAVEKYTVFARVTPQQKYAIIELLQKRYEVGFLGEGINDAPALKIANVALVVREASDIAKEASDIVLLKKSLRVIIDGIKEGRGVFTNTTKYITTTLSANFGNFIAVATASLFVDFLPMLPLQILLLNLLSDFPMIAVATDSIDKESIKKPSRYDFKELMSIAVVMGTISSIFDFIFFGLFVRISPVALQTGWFIGSVLTELVFLLSIRTKSFFLKSTSPSKTLLAFTGLAFLITLFLPYSTIGIGLFHFAPPSSRQLIILLTVVFAYLASTETVKLIYYKFSKKPVVTGFFCNNNKVP